MRRPGRQWLSVLVVMAAAAALVPGAAAEEDDPVEDARRAAQGLAYSGRVTVRWVDGRGEHRAVLDVRAAAGTLLLDGPAALMARGDERLVRTPGGAWDRLWVSRLQPQAGPSPGLKYEIVELPGPMVAGRATTVVEVSLRGVVRERLYLDRTTNLVLRREQLDPSGVARRAVAFEAFDVVDRVPPGAGPRHSRHLEPQRAEAARLDGPFRAPARLASGYRRLGTYQRGGTVHVLYSDGLYGLSLFQQAGRLDRDELPPAGRAVAVGPARGWQWTWAGGEIVLWSAGDAVYTAVSDAPLDDLLAAVTSIAPRRDEASAVEKLRRACRSMLRAFG